MFSVVKICENSKHISQYLEVTQHTEYSPKLVKVLHKHCIYISMLKKLHTIFYDHSRERPLIPLMKYSIQKDQNFYVFLRIVSGLLWQQPFLQICELSTTLRHAKPIFMTGILSLTTRQTHSTELWGNDFRNSTKRFLQQSNTPSLYALLKLK